jgi:hypothetical protein
MQAASKGMFNKQWRSRSATPQWKPYPEMVMRFHGVHVDCPYRHVPANLKTEGVALLAQIVLGFAFNDV